MRPLSIQIHTQTLAYHGFENNIYSEFILCKAHAYIKIYIYIGTHTTWSASTLLVIKSYALVVIIKEKRLRPKMTLSYPWRQQDSTWHINMYIQTSRKGKAINLQSSEDVPSSAKSLNRRKSIETFWLLENNQNAIKYKMAITLEHQNWWQNPDVDTSMCLLLV